MAAHPQTKALRDRLTAQGIQRAEFSVRMISGYVSVRFQTGVPFERKLEVAEIFAQETQVVLCTSGAPPEITAVETMTYGIKGLYVKTQKGISQVSSVEQAKTEAHADSVQVQREDEARQQEEARRRLIDEQRPKDIPLWENL